MRNWVIAAVMMSALPALAATQTKPVVPVKASADQEEIKKVMENFRVAVLNKDKPAFTKLFFNDKTSWIGVTTDNSLKILKEKKTDPNQPDPAKVFADDDPGKFIDGLIANSKRHFEEKFSNVRIDTDGNIGVVYFDYVFDIDGYKANSGKGSWHLVHSADGWKINSVIWSMEINFQPPKP